MVYVGSKSRICKYIVPIIQSYIDKNDYENFYDIFVGGGNLIDKIKCKNKIGSDVINDLIILHKKNQVGWEPYWFDYCIKYNDEQYRVLWELYKNFKNVFNGSFEITRAFFGFIVSYNGHYFDSFGVSKNNRNYILERFKNIVKQSKSPLYQDINFICKDYKEYDSTTKGLIYCDIPYVGTKDYKTDFNFNEFESWCFKTKTEHNTILLSEIALLDADKWKLIWSNELVYTHGANKKPVIEKLYEFIGDKNEKLFF